MNLPIAAILVLQMPVQDETWAAPVEHDPVRIELRQAPFFGTAWLDAARAGKETEDIARVTLTRPGWFMNARVEAGGYRLSIRVPRRSLRLFLRTAAGELVSSDSFWIDPPSESLPRAELAAADGAVLVVIRCGDIRIEHRFVPADALDRIATGTAVAGKAVTLVSDLDRPELAASLARECDEAVEVQAKLLGRPAPREPIRLFIFGDEKKYEAVDKLVAGGRFRRNGGFASPLTKQAYCWYSARREGPDLAGVGAPMTTRATLLHEFHHVLCYTLRPESVAWPAWLSEGLAEKATSASFQARSVRDDGAFRAYVRGRWRFADETGALPALEDLLGAPAGADLAGWYSSAFLFVDRLPPAKLSALLERLSAEELSSRAAVTAREFLEVETGGAGAGWRALRDEERRGDAPPVTIQGQSDRTAEGIRVITSPGGSGRMILQERVFGAQAVLEASFAWQACGERQADFYLAYAAGRDVTTFLKVAVLPKRIVLFRFADNRWARWGQRDFPDALAESTADAKAWHAVRIELDGKARRVSVQAALHATEFALPEHVPCDDARVGIGAHDSTVYFKEVRAR